MKLKPLVLFPAAAVCAALLVGCSSDDNAAPDLTCPTAAAPDTAATQWTHKGATGEVKVGSATADHGPRIAVTTPFTVTSTEVETLREGNGPEVTADDYVYVCYQGVNGRTGQVFDSSYQRGEATGFDVNRVVTGFQKALIGQKDGAAVAVAMTPADGYGSMGGSPDAGIGPDDTLIFELQIKKIGV